MSDYPIFAPAQKMRKLEVIVHAADLKLVAEIMREGGVAGWSMIRDVAGMGHDGFHQGRTVFSDETGLVMFVAVATAENIATVSADLAVMFRERPGVLFLSDVEVLRSDYVMGR